jgi:hypothetical protein
MNHDSQRKPAGITRRDLTQALAQVAGREGR